MRIKPHAALYIKLGGGGKWEQECIEGSQTLRLGYGNIPYEHSLCCEGKWEEVVERYEAMGKRRGVGTRHAKQIRLFYEAGEDVLWITFYSNRLWWCFSKPEVTLLEDGSKTRPVIGRWNSCDINGAPLEISRLSGKLLMLQGFQGTICSVREFDYLLRKINGETEPEVEAAKSARQSLVEKIEAIIRNLHWRDFELLVDLIFQRAGWSRISEVGGRQKTLDIALVAPITGERYGVQIKSQADLDAFREWGVRVGAWEGFAGFYFAVHSPSLELQHADTTERVMLLRPGEVAEWSVRYGLVDWIINKAG